MVLRSNGFPLCCVFFIKQKTAYEMRISDWSSDVCSSDLTRAETEAPKTNKAEVEKILADTLRKLAKIEGEGARTWGVEPVDGASIGAVESRLERARALLAQRKIGRASCRERVCQYV